MLYVFNKVQYYIWLYSFFKKHIKTFSWGFFGLLKLFTFIICEALKKNGRRDTIG